MSVRATFGPTAVAVVVLFAVFVASEAASAQSEIDDSATSSTGALYEAGITLVFEPQVTEDGRITLEPVPLFRGVTREHAVTVASESTFGVYSVAAGRFDLGEQVSGPSILGTPGTYAYDGYTWAGILTSNDLPTREIRTVVVATPSLKIGCATKRREVNLAVARPGLPLFESNDDFTGNPIIDHNLIVTLAMNDCALEAFYLESINGEVQSFQSRVTIEYWDDGEVAQIAFHGAAPTIDGLTTVSVVEAPIPLVFEDVFAYVPVVVEWEALDPISGTLGPPQLLTAVAQLPPVIPGMFPAMQTASTTTQAPTSAAATTASATGDVTDSTSLSSWLFGLMIPVILVVAWMFWTWWLRRKPYPVAKADTGPGQAVDTRPTPVEVDLVSGKIEGDEFEKMQRLENLFFNYRGSGDIAGVAEALVLFDEWHQETFGEPWLTWTNDSGPGTLIDAVTSDEFLLCRKMCCFEFVHLCAYIASDQLGRPRFDENGNVLDGMAVQWGIIPSVQDRSTLGSPVDRGSIITGRSYFGSNQAGYYHVGIGVGDGEVISLRNGGLVREPLKGLWGACFSPLVYYKLDVGKYRYTTINPAPAESK